MEPGASVTIFAERPCANAFTWDRRPADSGADDLQRRRCRCRRRHVPPDGDRDDRRRRERAQRAARRDRGRRRHTAHREGLQSRRPRQEAGARDPGDGDERQRRGLQLRAVGDGDRSVSRTAVRGRRSAPTGSPASRRPPRPLFPLGATPVTCIATDGAGNTGSTTFLVVVRKTEMPVLTGSNLTAAGAELRRARPSTTTSPRPASSPTARPRVRATPQSCSAWTAGVGGSRRDVSRLTVDRSATGHLYTSFAADVGRRLFKSTNGGGTWQELASPGRERH